MLLLNKASPLANGRLRSLLGPLCPILLGTATVASYSAWGEGEHGAEALPMGCKHDGHAQGRAASAEVRAMSSTWNLHGSCP